ncbi:hypothetical protein COV06_04150 [Candidatus Uhrbacteria bacterium CG10_big_fil_rev_8_21_14_0_10_50_16]|uniref:Uncharacterized protein n=1 Tax=Candidatus Uhrbacteria bacterium CG10_big_fil_rev_8_21_14_0_10_50_16 TaxID=1975039 RepID=A0A2H0RL29_9BACT|nr:MAG: hypothetical protein COV06_04150 [Candidatus Uhrbacteria bacterium CG10_big_fil_rev_8_21_14_0_10_50_16]
MTRRTAEQLAFHVKLLQDHGYTVIPPRAQGEGEFSQEELEAMAIALLVARQPGEGLMQDLLGWQKMNGYRTRILKHLPGLFYRTQAERYRTPGQRDNYEYFWEVLVHRTREDVLGLKQVGIGSANEFFSTLAKLGMSMRMPENHPLIREARARLAERACERS